MHPSSRPRLAPATSLAVAAAIAALPHAAPAELIYGLTNLQQIVTFDSSARTVTSTVSPPFSILGEILIGIDVRPKTGELFGISNQDKLYRLDPATGAATQVGPAFAIPVGSSAAIDFNPSVDRLRVVTLSGVNLRIHPDTGAVVDGDPVTPGLQPDGNLQYAAGDPNTHATPGLAAAAYSNNVAGAPTTTLYVIDPINDRLLTQVPPNAGTLNTIPGSSPLGINIADFGGFTGFDIASSDGTAYLTANNLFGTPAPTPNALYSVNLSTGLATLLGPVAGVNGTFRDIAVASVPEPASIATLSFAAVAASTAGRWRRPSR